MRNSVSRRQEAAEREANQDAIPTVLTVKRVKQVTDEKPKRETGKNEAFLRKHPSNDTDRKRQLVFIK